MIRRNTFNLGNADAKTPTPTTPTTPRSRSEKIKSLRTPLLFRSCLSVSRTTTSALSPTPAEPTPTPTPNYANYAKITPFTPGDRSVAQKGPSFRHVLTLLRCLRHLRPTPTPVICANANLRQFTPIYAELRQFTPNNAKFRQKNAN